MANISEKTQQELTDTAVMQSVVENKYIRDYCKSHPNTKPSFDDIIKEYEKDYSNGQLKDYKKSDLEVIKKDMTILKSFSQNHNADEYVIENIHSFGKGNGNSALISNGKNVFVTFNGTGPNGWIDNGQGLYMESTKLQRDAADQFDKYCRDYPELFKSENNVVIAGHSKGGNKAMYVTMSSKYSYLIDQCVAYDGQGFSQAAINKWLKENPENVYNEKINKITQVAGKYDFVNQLGIPIAGKKYYVDYKPWYLKNIGEIILGYDHHAHYGMFTDQNGQLALDFDCKPGLQDALLRQFMSEYMKLSPEEIKESAPQLMSLLELVIGDHNFTAADGEVVLPKIEGIVWALSKTSMGKALLAALGPMIIYYQPQLAAGIGACIIKVGLQKLSKGKQGSKTKTIGAISGSGSSVIMLDVETFHALDASFQIVFNNSFEAAQYAEKAESVNHDLSICGALTKAFSKRAADIDQINKKVIESFTSVDKENAKAAQAIGESYLGPEMYSSVVNSIVQTPPELAAQGIVYR